MLGWFKLWHRIHFCPSTPRLLFLQLCASLYWLQDTTSRSVFLDWMLHYRITKGLGLSHVLQNKVFFHLVFAFISHLVLPLHIHYPHSSGSKLIAIQWTILILSILMNLPYSAGKSGLGRKKITHKSQKDLPLFVIW